MCRSLDRLEPSPPGGMAGDVHGYQGHAPGPRHQHNQVQQQQQHHQHHGSHLPPSLRPNTSPTSYVPNFEHTSPVHNADGYTTNGMPFDQFGFPRGGSSGDRCSEPRLEYHGQLMSRGAKRPLETSPDSHHGYQQHRQPRAMPTLAPIPPVMVMPKGEVLSPVAGAVQAVRVGEGYPPLDDSWESTNRATPNAEEVEYEQATKRRKLGLSPASATAVPPGGSHQQSPEQTVPGEQSTASDPSSLSMYAYAPQGNYGRVQDAANVYVGSATNIYGGYYPGVPATYFPQQQEIQPVAVPGGYS